MQNQWMLESYNISHATIHQKTKKETKPKLDQFQQQSMAPFTEQLKNAASGFAGETGLTLDDLGFSTDNPSSAEAIKASHETLRLAAEKAQRDFGLRFFKCWIFSSLFKRWIPYKRNQLYQTKAKWQPVNLSSTSLMMD